MTDEPIHMKNWRSTPAVGGRAGTDLDVREGRAVFAIGGEPLAMDVPVGRLP